MTRHIAQRLALMVPLLLALSVATFVLLRIAPGDTAVARAGLAATPERVERLRHEMGLDKPLWEQYVLWLGDVLRGDLGQSATYQRPVAAEIADRAPVTIELMVLSLALTVLLGVPAGVVSALRRNSGLDYLVRVVSMFWLSIPSFWLGVLMLLGLAIWFDWAPPLGYVEFFSDPWKNLQQMLLPAVALAVGTAAVVIRLTRSAVLEIVRQDFVRTARSKGLPGRVVVGRHILKNAMIPVVTYLGLQAGVLLGGVVVIEQVFNLQGIGQLTYQGVFSRDFAVVEAVVLLAGVLFLSVNLLVDVLYTWLDPRIRYG